MTDNQITTEKIIWENNFSIEIPKSWSIEQDEELISLFDENNGIGVLQFSIAKRSISKAPIEDEIKAISKAYAAQRGWDADSALRFFKVFDLIASEFSILNDEDGQITYWRIWHILGEDRMAFFTYNCVVSDKAE